MLKVLDGKIDCKKTAVLVIDMSNDFVAEGGAVLVETGYKFAPKLNDFLNVCREKGMMVVYTSDTHRADRKDLNLNVLREEWQQGGTVGKAGTWDVEISDVCAPKDGEIIVSKQHHGAFYNTNMDVILRANNIENVIVTGVCTDVCCLEAATGAFNREYKVVFLADLNGAPDWSDAGFGTFENYKQNYIYLNNIAATRAQVMSSEEFINDYVE